MTSWLRAAEQENEPAAGTGRPNIIAGLMAFLLVFSALASLCAGSIFPVLGTSIVLSLGLRFHENARPVRRICDVFTVALGTIILLDIAGIGYIFARKYLVALALTGLEKNGLRSAYIRRSLFFKKIRLCSLVAFVFIGIAFAGSRLVRVEYALPDLSPGLLLLLGLGGSMLNAVSEETVYRGVLMSRLEGVLGSRLAILVQGVIFFIAHFWMKVPWGMGAMAVIFLFGIVMGWLVNHTRGLFSAIYVHFLVDLGLFACLLLQGWPR